MSVHVFSPRFPFLWILCAFLASPAIAQTSHYSVKLSPDFSHQVLRGEEEIDFQHDAGLVEWQKQDALRIISAESAGGDVRPFDHSVSVRLRASGKQHVHFQYQAAPARGIRWFANDAGFFTAFYCEAWMVCDNTPAQRATLRLEIVLPASLGLRAAGPGALAKQWRDGQDEHFIFEQTEPVQTYLFSFEVAKLAVAAGGNLAVYSRTADSAKVVLSKTSDAYAFLRGKATVDPIDTQYSQAFIPLPGSFGQEAAGLALLSDDYLPALEKQDDVSLLAHELAHQWWGVLVGIRSWSDFWLNEGMAEFMADVYIEHHQGKAAYSRRIGETRERMNKLHDAGHDRPLHWEGWKDAHEALGEIPYVKGVLFLDRLRTALGEEKFWRGIGLYTARYAHQLVDSYDFQHAMEEASGCNLQALFAEAVYR